jgi:ketosteroid isomerase-like protein
MDLERHGWHPDTWLGGEAMIVATLRRCHAAYSRGDFDAAVTVLHQDIELVPPGRQSAVKGIHAVRAWMEPDAFAEQILEPLDVWVAGHTALVRVSSRARGAASGIELEFAAWTVWTFDAFGLATRMEIYLGHEEAEARLVAGVTDGVTQFHWRSMSQSSRPL